jgi:thiamine biosynthesis lipoprotein
MGTEFRITVGSVDTSGLQTVVDSVFGRIDALEQIMSDYRADSQLNRLTGSTRWQQVSPDLYEVLRFSRELARRSRGAFDPTVGPLTKLWRRAFRQQAFPEEERIEAARARVGWKDLRTGRRSPRVRLRRTDVQLDLGGVAKGYTIDVAGGLLRRAGFPAFIVDGGGDLLLGDAPPGGAWSVKLPGGDHKGVLHNTAVATSGDTYRFLEWEGVRYSHIIDPRTGYGITGSKQVTVIGPSAMVADGLASAVSVSAGGWVENYPEYAVSYLTGE